MNRRKAGHLQPRVAEQETRTVNVTPVSDRPRDAHRGARDGRVGEASHPPMGSLDFSIFRAAWGWLPPAYGTSPVHSDSLPSLGCLSAASLMRALPSRVTPGLQLSQRQEGL